VPLLAGGALLCERGLTRAGIQTTPFLTEMPSRAHCLECAQNLGGEVMWASWFELPASYLDELTPCEYARIAVCANTPTNRISPKSSIFSCGEI
jgi:hypothetical protein